MSGILVSVYDFVTTLFQTSVPGPPGEPEPDLNTAGAVEPVVPVVSGPALPSGLIAGRVVAGVEFWADSASPVVEWAVIEHSEDFVFQLFHTTSAAELDQALPPYLDQFCSHRDLLHADLVWTPRGAHLSDLLTDILKTQGASVSSGGHRRNWQPRKNTSPSIRVGKP